MLVSILPAVLRVPCGRLSGKKGLTLSAELPFVLIHSIASVPLFRLDTLLWFVLGKHLSSLSCRVPAQWLGLAFPSVSLFLIMWGGCPPGNQWLTAAKDRSGNHGSYLLSTPPQEPWSHGAGELKCPCGIMHLYLPCGSAVGHRDWYSPNTGQASTGQQLGLFCRLETWPRPMAGRAAHIECFHGGGHCVPRGLLEGDTFWKCIKCFLLSF